MNLLRVAVQCSELRDIALWSCNDRMPVLLRPDQFYAWLDGSAGREVLVPAAEDMLNKVPVSQRVNSSRAPNDDPRLIEPISLAA